MNRTEFILLIAFIISSVINAFQFGKNFRLWKENKVIKAFLFEVLTPENLSNYFGKKLDEIKEATDGSEET